LLKRLICKYAELLFCRCIMTSADLNILAFRIILLFDAHKLDISDELKGAIDVLKGHEDKIRCILNKADQIDRQQLMRVYGALLWSLGKTMTSPEVCRVYVGSFWQENLKNLDNAELFEQEEKDLMKDMAVLPRQSAVRKINELVKRIRKVKTLAYIIAHLKAEMPAMMGKEKKQKKLIADLPNVFRTILKKHNLAAGDFPELTNFSAKLAETKFTDFHSFSQKTIDALDQVLNVDIPKLMEELPSEKDSPETLRVKMGQENGIPTVPIPTTANKFGRADDSNNANPFGFDQNDEDHFW
jgi:EH domain-containing protein 1